MLFTSLGRSVLGKLGLEYHPSTTSRLRAQFFSIRTSRLVNNICFFFFSEGKVTNLAVSLVLSAVRIFLPLPTGTVTLVLVTENIPSFAAILLIEINFVFPAGPYFQANQAE